MAEKKFIGAVNSPEEDRSDTLEYGARTAAEHGDAPTANFLQSVAAKSNPGRMDYWVRDYAVGSPGQQLGAFNSFMGRSEERARAFGEARPVVGYDAETGQYNYTTPGEMGERVADARAEAFGRARPFMAPRVEDARAEEGTRFAGPRYPKYGSP